MSKPVYQHLVPRVYLKQFQIDNTANKSFVYCLDFSRQYSNKIQKLGVNDKVFKEKKYYNHEGFNDPFTIERMFSEEVEPTYNKIIEFIVNEKVLTEDIINDIIIWLFVTTHRGKYLRWNTNRVMSKIIEFQNLYKKHTPIPEEQKVIDDYVRRSSKDIQLSVFTDKEKLEELSELFTGVLYNKLWCILKAPKDNFFLTNDNPGFSINTIAKFAIDRPFHPLLEMNDLSINYFVLSPKYCLKICPFPDGYPENISALNMEIPFMEVTEKMVDYINIGVIKTQFNLLISKSKSQLQKYTKLV